MIYSILKDLLFQYKLFHKTKIYNSVGNAD